MGGVIKAYSYMLVPYIVAENPGIGHKEAINLSRKMMKGNKWRAFVLDLSFLGWKILSLLSFGLIGIFFTNAYTTAAKAELYLAIREKELSYYRLLLTRLRLAKDYKGSNPLLSYQKNIGDVYKRQVV